MKNRYNDSLSWARFFGISHIYREKVACKIIINSNILKEILEFK
jgi:hypothetical protein